MSYAVRNGKLSVNPCAKIEKLYKSNRSDVIWTDAHLALLQKHASPDVFRAAKLSSLTGLRQDDCMTLKWTELDKLAIEKVTAKSISKRRKSDPKIAIIPMYKELKEFLSSIERDNTYVLTSSKGEPWSGFSSSWNDTLKKAGLDKLDLHFHDLRGTAATKFYSIGLTVTDIALILGWSEKDVTKILDKYVNRSAVLRQRIRRMNRAIEAQEAAEVEDAAEIENVA
jgi:integrase